MGRPRKTNIHLPPKVYQDKKSGMYYFVDANNKYHRLGREMNGAISQYYKLMPHHAESFSSAWQRAMQRALKQGLEKRFAERYIRNKVVTDCNDLVKASKTVGHTNTSVTKQHYSMLGTRVEPFEKRI